MLTKLKERIRYEMTYSLSERYNRRMDKIALWLAHRMPIRLKKWAIIDRHAALTMGDVHPGNVTAFDLTRDL